MGQAAVDVCKMALRIVEPDANIFKAGFHFFCSIFDQNTLQEISRTKRKYAQECLRGKNGFLSRKSDNVPKMHLDDEESISSTRVFDLY